MYVTDKIDSLKPKQPDTTRFVCMSDTHGRHQFDFTIPDGDVFVHAGDLTRHSRSSEFKDTVRWIKALPHSIKIITAGNHDHLLDDRFGCVEQKQLILSMIQQAGIIYLEHESFQLPESLGGFKMFVSPYAPVHLGGAFMPKDLAPIWSSIPNDIDILVTHSPPFGFHDRIAHGGKHVGCPILRQKIDTIRPRVCISGHIHEDRGWSMANDILFINACTCNRSYRPTQSPIVFDLRYDTTK